MNEWLKRNRALLGYFLLLVVVVLALELHHTRDNRQIRKAQAVACAAAHQVADNQRLVLQSLIRLRTAALDSPYLRLEAERELGKLRRALRAVPSGGASCESLLE